MGKHNNVFTPAEIKSLEEIIRAVVKPLIHPLTMSCDAEVYAPGAAKPFDQYEPDLRPVIESLRNELDKTYKQLTEVTAERDRWEQRMVKLEGRLRRAMVVLNGDYDHE